MLSTTTPEIRYITRFVHEQPMKVAHYWVRLTRNGEKAAPGYCDRRSVCRGCHRGNIGLVDGCWKVGTK